MATYVNNSIQWSTAKERRSLKSLTALPQRYKTCLIMLTKLVSPAVFMFCSFIFLMISLFMRSCSICAEMAA